MKKKIKLWTLHFLHAFPLKWRDSFFILKNWFLKSFWSRHLPFCGPHISCMRFHSNGETRFLFWEIDFWKVFGVTTYFCFIFKGKNKIIKKNPKCDSWRKNRSIKSRVWVWGSGYLLEKYGKKTVVPL